VDFEAQAAARLSLKSPQTGSAVSDQKTLCRSRAVRARQEKVVNRGQADPFTRQIKSSKLVVT
jgi:hypothetical protein